MKIVPMKNTNSYTYPFIVGLTAFLLLSGACKSYYEISSNEANYYKMDSLFTVDSSINDLIAPYKKKLESEMNVVIATNAMDLPKAQPESLLGNWTADAILTIAQQQYKQPIDFAVSNYGGLRIPNLPKGDITRGQIFELMPFDNMLVVVHLNANDLQIFLDHIAKKEGWPISKGIQMMIDQDKASNVLLNGEPINNQKTYAVLVSDYMANGGDNCSFLVEQKRDDIGLLFRDALLQYAEQQTANNLELSAKIEGRIHYAE